MKDNERPKIEDSLYKQSESMLLIRSVTNDWDAGFCFRIINSTSPPAILKAISFHINLVWIEDTDTEVSIALLL